MVCSLSAEIRQPENSSPASRGRIALRSNAEHMRVILARGGGVAGKRVIGPLARAQSQRRFMSAVPCTYPPPRGLARSTTCSAGRGGVTTIPGALEDAADGGRLGEVLAREALAAQRDHLINDGRARPLSQALRG